MEIWQFLTLKISGTETHLWAKRHSPQPHSSWAGESHRTHWSSLATPSERRGLLLDPCSLLFPQEWRSYLGGGTEPPSFPLCPCPASITRPSQGGANSLFSLSVPCRCIRGLSSQWRFPEQRGQFAEAPSWRHFHPAAAGSFRSSFWASFLPWRLSNIRAHQIWAGEGLAWSWEPTGTARMMAGRFPHQNPSPPLCPLFWCWPVTAHTFYSPVYS